MNKQACHDKLSLSASLTRCSDSVSEHSKCNMLACKDCIDIVLKCSERDEAQETKRARADGRSSRSRRTKMPNSRFFDTSTPPQTKSKPKCSHCENGSDCAVKYTREEAIKEILVNGFSHLKNDTLSELRGTGYYKSSAQDYPDRASKCVLCMPNKGSCYLI